MKSISVGFLIATLTFACGHRAQQQSVVRSIASTANYQLIEDLQQNEEMSLSAVLAKKEYYGLDDKEVKAIRDVFTADEYARLVLNFVDPNHLRGTVAPRWAFVPEVPDRDKELTAIEVVDKQGHLELIDGTKKPEDVKYPIITLSFSETLEGAVRLKLAQDDADNVADGALMLDAVQFSNVEEPWIKGSAEMYAVVSFIGKDGQGTSTLLELPSVDESDKRYELRQVLHLWPANRYQFLNVAFFEHDSGYNFAELTKVFITAAATIVTSVLDPTQTTTIAIVSIVGELAGKIIDALPDDAMTDDDDYVDTINTIEKYTPSARSGVSGNAKAEFSYYEATINDE